MAALTKLGRRLAGWVDGEYPITAADLEPGMELRGALVSLTPAGDEVRFAPVVDRCRPETFDGVAGVRVWWTAGGECWYPAGHELRALVDLGGVR